MHFEIGPLIISWNSKNANEGTDTIKGANRITLQKDLEYF